MNLVTPKAGAKQELLINKLASGYLHQGTLTEGLRTVDLLVLTSLD